MMSLIKKRFLTAAILLLIVLQSLGQTKEFGFSDAEMEARIRQDVTLLASDSLMGREAGSMGEWMARSYIAERFEEIGLKPMFIDSYFQRFSFDGGANLTRGNWLKLDGKQIRLCKDYYPLAYSTNDTVDGELVNVGYGITSQTKEYDDYKNLSGIEGKIFVIELGIPIGKESNEELQKLSGKFEKITNAQTHGAKAVIFITSDMSYGVPSNSLTFYTEQASIPVLFITDKSLITGKSQVSLAVEIDSDPAKSAYNVGGYIDNGADYWVVIGGHYDHEGFKTDYKNVDEGPQVYNGADDNATGTAGMLELARFVKSSGLKKFNYVFLAFSAEEKGLVGSTYFTNSKVVQNEKISYMIDLDMIGKLSTNKKMKVFGVATAEEWDPAISKAEKYGIKIQKIKSGAGGSDHMPFYYKNVPNIFIHTGLHKDYHTPADDIDKIDFEGVVKVIKFTESLIKTLEEYTKLTFMPVSSAQLMLDLGKLF